MKGLNSGAIELINGGIMGTKRIHHKVIFTWLEVFTLILLLNQEHKNEQTNLLQNACNPLGGQYEIPSRNQSCLYSESPQTCQSCIYIIILVSSIYFWSELHVELD